LAASLSKKTPSEKQAADQYAAATKASSSSPKVRGEAKKEAKKSTSSSSKKSGGTDFVGALVGDVVVATLGGALALALLAPGVKDKLTSGDVEGAVADAQKSFNSIDGVPGKAAYVGGVLVADAVVHLPLLGAIIPGPTEFVGTAAALLLAAKYFVDKETTAGDDLTSFGSSLPTELPSVDDILKPASGFASRLGDLDLDILQDDLKQAPARVQSWFGGLDDPVEVVAPPAAALGATVLVGQIAHLPILALVLPRALEVVGMACLLNAVNKFGTDDSASLKDDLANVAAKAGGAVKKLAGK
jgi:hypothetical protein